MDIKKEVEKIIDKVKNDKDFSNKFKSNPVEAVESVLGVDLPEDKINDVVKMVSTKINIDDGNIGAAIGNLFK